MNSIDFFDRGYQISPNEACLIDHLSGTQMTYAEVRALTFRIARTLHEKGYGVGSKVAVLAPNDPRAYAVSLGLARAGAVWLPVNVRGSSLEVTSLLELFDCELVFYSESCSGSVELAKERLPAIREFIALEKNSNDLQLEEWVSNDDSPFILPPDPDRLWAIDPTGGTTGLPKGPLVLDQGLETCVANLTASMPCATRPVFLAAAPLTHAAGYIMQYVMSQGGTGVILPPSDLDLLLETIPKYKITHLFLPPTVIYGLLGRPKVREIDYSSLDYLVYGASPMAPEKLAEAVEVFGPILAQVYGQKETGMPNTYLSPADHFEGGVLGGKLASAERLSSCGRATPFSHVEILDDEGQALGAGEIGELVVAGRSVTPAYYKNPGATTEAKTGAWHHTGDVGYKDEEGYIYIVDRKKDIIITGGFNVYSSEIEKVILQHPSVSECGVIGIPDEKWGEAVTAFVELRADKTVDESELLQMVRTQLGPVKTPKKVFFVDVLPRNANGKLLKREIRDEFWRDQGRNV